MPSKSPLIKVLFLFMVGIILPTGFLVYLGVLSIRSETLLLKKESQERVGKTGEALQEQAQTILNEQFTPFTQLAQDPGPDRIADFRRTHETSLLIALDPSEQILYPAHDTRHHRPPALIPLSSRLRDRVTAAELAEFKDHDYAAAANLYHAIEKETDQPRWKAILLNSRAGCLVKLGQFDAAQAAYQEILSRYGQELDQEGYPFSLVIASQLGELQTSKGRPDLAINQQLHVLQDLVSGRWDLSWDELAFFVRRTVEKLHALSSHLGQADRERFQKLEAEWNRSQQAAAEARQFIRQRWPALQKTLREQDRAGLPFLLLTNPDTARGIVYAPSYDRATGRLQTTVLAEISIRPFLDKLQQTLSQLTSASGLTYRLEIDPRHLLAESRQKPEGKRWTIQASLAQMAPPIKLSIAPVSDIPVERAAQRRRQVYLAMVALAAVVILIALYATWYAVSREVEVAQLKSRFVASISHELKTPLSIIGLVGQKLQLGRYASAEEAQEYYGMLSEETSRLKGLIDDVLDFSRLMENRQPYHRTPVDLVELVRETVERFRNSAAAQSAQISFQADQKLCRVLADRDALGRAVLNLLDNAVKYSPADRIRIRVGIATQNGQATVTIEDEGYGIAAEERGLVFERFFRGHSASDHQKTSGAGLGLAIVKHIVTAHQGRIDLQSTVGKGSIFTIQLPMNGIL